MYFTSRAHAGWFLAQQLMNYRYEDCVVVALSDGAVQVGEQIASQLHCILTLLLMEDVAIPGEDTVIGTVDMRGGFTYNNMISAGEIEEYYTEFRGYLEDKKRQSYENMNRLLGDGGVLSDELVKDRVVILVSDGFKNGVSLNAAGEYFKRIRVKRLVIAAPIASVEAVDRMHVTGDEIHVLGVTNNYLDTDHYYDQNDVPSREDTIAKINQIILNWK